MREWWARDGVRQGKGKGWQRGGDGSADGQGQKWG